MTVPTSRAFLTSLLNTLTTPLPANPTKPQVNFPHGNDDSPSNPLKALPPSHRALLTTLHVVFPPPMLLQALDLLDRGLVTRFVQKNDTSSAHQNDSDGEEAQIEEPIVAPPHAYVQLPTASSPSVPTGGGRGDVMGGKLGEGVNTVYQVRSSQLPKARFRESTAGTALYTVRLQAWNCSCAAFAFAAFPADGGCEGALSTPWRIDHDGDEAVGDRDRRVVEEKGEKWEFGGMSNDGRDGGSVSVCKHLLACVLGERWDVLKGYVKERVVGREEMAGAGAES